jgi:hypothetical protein
VASPDEPSDPQQSADDAVAFFERCVERGLSRREAADLTVAYVLGKKVSVDDPKPDEPWRK